MAAVLRVPRQLAAYAYTIASSGAPSRSVVAAYMEGSTIVLGHYRFYLDAQNQLLGYSAITDHTPAVFYTPLRTVPSFVTTTLGRVSAWHPTHVKHPHGPIPHGVPI